VVEALRQFIGRLAHLARQPEQCRLHCVDFGRRSACLRLQQPHLGVVPLGSLGAVLKAAHDVGDHSTDGLERHQRCAHADALQHAL